MDGFVSQHTELPVSADELNSKEVQQRCEGTTSLMVSVAVVATEHFNAVVGSFVILSIFYMYVCSSVTL